MTGHVVSYFALKPRTNVADAENIDQEVGQFMRAVRQVFGPLMPNRIVVKEFGVLKLDHGGAGTGWSHHLFAVGKSLDGVAGEIAGVVVIAAVKVGLAAARLRVGKSDLNAKATEKANCGHAHVGEEGVAEAGDHQGHF